MNRLPPRLLLGMSLVVGLSLRLAYLADRPIWYDEAFSLLLARRPVPELLAGTAADTMPPLYYLLLKGWLAFGESIAYARLMNVFLGVGLIGLAYVLGRAYFQPQAGAWAAILLAVSPFLIYHAQELRMYTLLAVALAGYAWACQRMIGLIGRDEGGLLGAIWPVTACAAVALYTHNLAIFTLVVPNLVLLLRRRWAEQRALLVAQGTALLIFTPWLVLVPGQIQKIQAAFWTPQPGLLELVQAIVSLHVNLPVADSLIPVVVFGSLLAIVLVAYGVVRGRDQLRWMPLGFMLLPPALLWITSYLMRPVFVPRAFILSLVAYALVVGLLIVRPPLRGLGWVLLVVMLATAAIGLPSFYTFRSFPRSPFDQAAERLSASVGAGDRIVHDNKLSYFPMVIYRPDLPMAFLADEPGSHNDTLAHESAAALGLTPQPDIESATEGAPAVWFVVFQRAIDEHRQLGKGEHPAIAWLTDHYTLVGQEAVGDLWLLHFGPPVRAELTSTQPVGWMLP
jgi:hypothetical protein